MGMFKVAIIAAIEREVRPLVQGWKIRSIQHAGRNYRLYEKGNVTVICGGIGAEAARRATEAVIQEIDPARVISVGFAGSLDRSLTVGRVIEPRTVISVSDGVRTETTSGDGILLSAATVVNVEQKSRFAKAYGASAVDMEASAVAAGARARGIEFAALKAISDAADFEIPATERFIGRDGSFRTFRFAGHVALRPWLWRATWTLARHSAKASHALCTAITAYVGRVGVNRENSHSESLRGALNPINVGLESGSVHTRAGLEAHTEGMQPR